MKQLPEGQYNFKEVEKKILEFWLSKPFYKPEYDPSTDVVQSLEDFKSDPRPKWTLVCPPPNAYDRPHMGNLSGYPYMDAQGRYQRMQGKRVLLFPGKDHAGIEGEVSYIKYFLEPEGKSKFDFTREEFFQKLYESQQGFMQQIRKDELELGLSADFDRDLYTMDPKVVNEVLNTFTGMYKDGLIYKGVRIVNWDPKSQSAISDSQCERKEVQGKLYYIKYKLVDSDEVLMVATTRPETMLGDTALVVNPTDERYTNLVGKKVILPLANREIPIITNGRIEKEFGTGVLKLTPAHAPDDYQIMIEWNEEVEKKDLGEDKKIDYINIIDRKTKLCGPIPEKYIGLKVNAAREEIVKDLKAQGFLEKEEDIIQNLLISERTGATIEPIMSSQWFINVSTLKPKLLEVIQNGELKIHPKAAEKKYISWVENLRDWAISRNLWWGYRLPVWYNGTVEEEIDSDGKVTQFITKEGQKAELDPLNPDHMRVQIEQPDAGWLQDEDILDTWFSSGQWPLLCLQTSDLMDQLYPTDVLVSGYDLLIKWDLFMVLFGIYKTGKPPFKDLYLTGLVKGTDGQKMSKSKRNFVPIDDVKEQFGTDSFRMNCFYQNKAGKAYAITPESLKNFRNFNNKIWNASKFVMMNLDSAEDKSFLDEVKELRNITSLKKYLDKKLETADTIDKDFVNELEAMEKEFENDTNSFKFGLITEKLYHSFWHSFCDSYIEKVKGKLFIDRTTGTYKEEASEESRLISRAILAYSLMSYLRMLHPFIPFITEEIWQHLVANGDYKMPLIYA